MPTEAENRNLALQLARLGHVLVKHQVAREDLSVTIVGDMAGDWSSMIHFGREAPDSPMVGGTALGSGSSAVEVLQQALDEMKVPTRVEDLTPGSVTVDPADPIHDDPEVQRMEEERSDPQPIEAMLPAVVTLERSTIERVLDQRPLSPAVEQRLRMLMTRTAKASIRIERGDDIGQLNDDGMAQLQDQLAALAQLDADG